MARLTAEKLGFKHIDSGAMYRAVALKCLRERIDTTNERECERLAKESQIQFIPHPAGQRVLLDGEDVTEAIRMQEVTEIVSPLSAIPGVRKALVAEQRKLGSEGGVVMEGRDIGTVVFPNADIKVFLTASAEVRAMRRHKELAEKGIVADLNQTVKDIEGRDLRDTTRIDSPLRRAKDAVLIDSDNLTAEEVSDEIIKLVSELGK